jgi:hypothetical protein
VPLSDTTAVVTVATDGTGVGDPDGPDVAVGASVAVGSAVAGDVSSGTSVGVGVTTEPGRDEIPGVM